MEWFYYGITFNNQKYTWFYYDISDCGFKLSYSEASLLIAEYIIILNVDENKAIHFHWNPKGILSVLTHCYMWLKDVRWLHRSGAALSQEMACCLTATSHYLNQCWLITEAHWHLAEGNFDVWKYCYISLEPESTFWNSGLILRPGQYQIQSNVVVTRSNITWYCTHHCSNGGRISARVWTHKRCPIYCF